MGIIANKELVGIGIDGYMALAPQSNRETINTNPNQTLYYNATYASGLYSSPGRIENENIMGDLMPVPHSRGKQMNEGSMETYVTDENVSDWLYFALGIEDAAPVATIAGETPKTHVWSHTVQKDADDWNGKYFTVRQAMGESMEERYIGARASSFTIKGEDQDVGSQIMFMNDISVYQHVDTGSPFPRSPGIFSEPGGDNFLFSDAILTVVPYDTNDLNYDVANARVGGTDFELMSFEFKVEYNLRNTGTGGSRYINPAIRQGMPAISFAFNTYQDMRWIREMRNFNYYAITLEVFTPNRIVSTLDGTRRGFRIDLPKCALMSDTKTPREKELARFDLAFTDFHGGKALENRGAAEVTNELYRIISVDAARQYT